jgi:hypothetical protein
VTAIKAEQLIEQLAGWAPPVTRLLAPWVRTTLWLVVAAADITLLVLLMSPQRDLAREPVSLPTAAAMAGRWLLRWQPLFRAAREDTVVRVVR